MTYQIHVGDCLDTLRAMPDNSVDSIVTDPPYGLSDHKPADVAACLQAWLAGEPYMARKKGFMGQTWDSWVPGPEVWRECLRVLKPGGHLLAFAGTRTMDLMSMAVRLSGFELRDSIGYAHDGGGAPVMAWCYGSGFPKSTDVSKQIDKRAGAEREVIAPPPYTRGKASQQYSETRKVSYDYDPQPITAPATGTARQWQGWGSALKPAWEPIIMARKPLIGTIAENVLEHGAGGINVDGCRVATADDLNGGRYSDNKQGDDGNCYGSGINARSAADYLQPAGRWPANLILQDCDEVLGAFPKDGRSTKPSGTGGAFKASGAFPIASDPVKYADTGGSAARFFYCAKASKRDRGEGNTHPTVKPTDLMRYLCRLVTPPGGVVLDPFTGSGSTGKAAMLEGFSFIGCELSPEYAAIAEDRIAEAARHD